MAINYVIGESVYYINLRPARIIINTDDSLETVMTEGYLDGETSLVYSNDLVALVLTTDGVVELSVSVTGEHTSLIAPLSPL